MAYSPTQAVYNMSVSSLDDSYEAPSPIPFMDMEDLVPENMDWFKPLDTSTPIPFDYEDKSGKYLFFCKNNAS